MGMGLREEGGGEGGRSQRTLLVLTFNSINTVKIYPCTGRNTIAWTDSAIKRIKLGKGLREEGGGGEAFSTNALGFNIQQYQHC